MVAAEATATAAMADAAAVAVTMVVVGDDGVGGGGVVVDGGGGDGGGEENGSREDDRGDGAPSGASSPWGGDDHRPHDLKPWQHALFSLEINTYFLNPRLRSPIHTQTYFHPSHKGMQILSLK